MSQLFSREKIGRLLVEKAIPFLESSDESFPVKMGPSALTMDPTLRLSGSNTVAGTFSAAELRFRLWNYSNH